MKCEALKAELEAVKVEKSAKSENYSSEVELEDTEAELKAESIQRMTQAASEPIGEELDLVEEENQKSAAKELNYDQMCVLFGCKERKLQGIVKRERKEQGVGDTAPVVIKTPSGDRYSYELIDPNNKNGGKNFRLLPKI